MDRLTKEQRHKNMQAVKNKDSKIELMLRSALWNKGYRYRKNYTKIEGNIQRDKTVNKILKEQGWKVIRFWGKDIQKNLDSCVDRIEKEIGV